MNHDFLSISPDNIIAHGLNGTYFVNAGQTNNPDSTSQWVIIQNIMINNNAGGSYGVQFAFAVDNNNSYYRVIWNGTPRTWKLFV